MPVLVAENPLDSVVLGSGRCVEDFDALQPVLGAETAASRAPRAARPRSVRTGVFMQTTAAPGSASACCWWPDSC